MGKNRKRKSANKVDTAPPPAAALTTPLMKVVLGKRDAEETIEKPENAKIPKMNDIKEAIATKNAEPELKVNGVTLSKSKDLDESGSDDEVPKSKVAAIKDGPVEAADKDETSNEAEGEPSSDAGVVAVAEDENESSDGSDVDNSKESNDEEDPKQKVGLMRRLLPKRLVWSNFRLVLAKEDPEQKQKDVETVDAPKTPYTPEVQSSKGSKSIFVGNLPFKVENSDIENHFKEAGEVIDVRIALRPDGKMKGYGHVEFASAAAAKKAVDQMNGKELSGRALRLDLAKEIGVYTPQDGGEGNIGEKVKAQTIFIRGLDKSDDEFKIKDALQEHFGSCGEITGISVPTESKGKIRYTPEVQSSKGSKSIYVGNLPFKVENSDIENHFKEAGEVVDVRIALRPDGKMKGYGHVEFASAAAAKKAVDQMNGKELSGRALRLDLAKEIGECTPQDGGEGNIGEKVKAQTIFIRELDKSDDEFKIKDALQEHFGSCGEITGISVPTESKGKIRGIAYLDFKDKDASNKALELNQSEPGESVITVEEAKPRRI